MSKRMFSGAQLRRLIAPLVIEQLLVMLVGMLDTIMVSLSLIHISEPTRPY